MKTFGAYAVEELRQRLLPLVGTLHDAGGRQLSKRVVAKWQQDLIDGNLCRDEGCPHYGTPHGHVE